MASCRWTVSVDNCSAVHADICSRCPANKGAKAFKRVIFNTNPALHHRTIQLCKTRRSIKCRSTLRSCWVIRFTPDSRPKTSLQQVKKLQASSATLFTFWFFYWSLFHPFCSAIHFKGRKCSCSRQWAIEERLSHQTTLTDPFTVNAGLPIVSCHVYFHYFVTAN